MRDLVRTGTMSATTRSDKQCQQTPSPYVWQYLIYPREAGDHAKEGLWRVSLYSQTPILKSTHLEV